MANTGKSTIATERPVKEPSESRLYSFDFSRKLSSGETLSNPQVTLVGDNTTPALTIDAPSVVGALVQVRISAGLSPTIYRLQCLVDTNLSNTLECDGYLVVQD